MMATLPNFSNSFCTKFSLVEVAFEWLIQVMLLVMAIAVPKLPPPMIAIFILVV